MSSDLRKDHQGLVADPELIARLLSRAATERDKSRSRKINTILSAAVTEFAEQGMSGFSMRRIASTAGITLSTLQHYFGNRDNLLIVTISSLCARYIAKHTRSRGPATPKRRLEMLIDHLLASLTDPLVSRFYTNLWATAAQNPKINAIVRESYGRYYEILADLVAEMRPDLTRDRAHALAVWVGALIDGLLVAQVIAAHGLRDWKALAEKFKAQCLAAIEKA